MKIKNKISKQTKVVFARNIKYYYEKCREQKKNIKNTLNKKTVSEIL